ncbi:MAG TPA: bifunctional DNA-formamidopyrimidine glycosylase/DNA-(apurinic or apyrimidinic site) lyase [Pyrinomonadaceae bacterium]|jgi:formamidopyrimidine-DNA glycosylase|nr:bifunctional DNA-formamidopyrimidine glycosylase/DNA-(apurinic or apyrimidinic site) lyase [Pyrinomonadaceae bacterium]
MPELPEVEHVVRALRRVILGRTIVASEVRLAKLIAPLTVASFNRRIKNARIIGVSRRGKFILAQLARPTGSAGVAPPKRAQRAQNLILAVHLRMTGKFVLLNTDDELPKHAHAIFYLDQDQRLVFRDQRQFGVMKLIDSSKLSQTKGIKELAPEPFGDEFDLNYLKETLNRSQRSLKTLLLDQTKVLGLGNIYAAEALFRARINPFKPANKLSPRRVPALYDAIREVLQFAVDHIRGSISLEEGFSYGAAFERFWQVYEREGEPCVRCGAKIRRATHGGRSTYWCPKCQTR